jgi:hypothetical protein
MDVFLIANSMPVERRIILSYDTRLEQFSFHGRSWIELECQSIEPTAIRTRIQAIVRSNQPHSANVLNRHRKPHELGFME